MKRPVLVKRGAMAPRLQTDEGRRLPMSKVTFVALAFALPALVAGCVTTYEPYPSAYPAASVPVVVTPEPNTDAPRIENSDAAGVTSVPGYRSGTVIVVPQQRPFVVPQAPFVAPAR
jgi:hypothetical protein